MYHGWSVLGLAIASDIGIFAQTAALAILLHRRGLVPLGNMRWGELAKALASADIKERFATIGFVPVGSSPEEFAALIKSDTENWSKVIRAANLKPDL